MHTNFHNIPNRGKNFFCQLLNIHGINDVRWREIHAAEPLVSEPIYIAFEIAIEKLEGIDHNRLMKLWCYLLKNIVEYFVQISIDLSLHFGLGRNFLNSGSTLFILIYTLNEIDSINNRGTSLLPCKI